MSKKKGRIFCGPADYGRRRDGSKNLLDELKERNDLELVVVANVKEKYFLNWFKRKQR